MDVVLDFCDQYILDSVYPTDMHRDNIPRQIISLLLIVNIGGFFIYMIPATLSYLLLFDKRHLNHPQILEVGSTGNLSSLCKLYFS